MKKVAFIGSYDKSDMLLCMAKLLVILNQKVIVIDATALQKCRYVVPVMKPQKKYITTYQGVEVAIGFESLEDLILFQKENGEEKEYDFALVDIDSSRGYRAFEITPSDKHYFVTSFDVFNLKRGLQILKNILSVTEVTKVLFTKEMDATEDEYLNFLSSSLKIKWNHEIVFFPFETSDLNAMYVNQRSGRIRVRGLSNQYIDSLMYITEDFSEISEKNLRRALKILEKN